mgnify:CR=1 FL=1
MNDAFAVSMIEGGIPGAKNGLVTVRHAVKKKLGKQFAGAGAK